MKKLLSIPLLLQYILPATLTLFMLFTIVRTVEMDSGGYEKLYGFPLPFISSNYAFTHHYDVYIFAMLVDLLFYFLITCVYFNLVQGLGVKWKTHRILVFLGCIVIIYWIVQFAAISFESSFKWTNDFDYKTTGRGLHFGIYP